jgi:hypothetical protein
VRLTTKDVVATLLVAAVVVPYIGYLIAGEMPFIKDPRGMAATGLVLGLAAAVVAGRAAFTPKPLHRAALVSGLVALALGVVALAVGTSEILLGLFVVGIVVTWGMGELAAQSDRHPSVQHV